MEFIITFIGIIFGGGMIGNLIQFFVKRQDEKKKSKRKFYRYLFFKLQTYQNDIYKLILEYIEDTAKINESYDIGINKINKRIAKIQSMKRSLIVNQYRLDTFGQNKEIISKCKSIEEEISCNIESHTKEKEDLKNKLQDHFCFWYTNRKKVIKIISDNFNFKSMFLSNGNCNKKCLQKVAEIDKRSSNLLFLIHETKDYHSAKKYTSELISQMENINNALTVLSKAMN